jgi:DNA-binding CsgD family transcriptional regulator
MDEIDIANRKIESFEKVLDGDTYKRVAEYYGISASAVRENVGDVFRMIKGRNRLDLDLVERRGRHDIILARANKQFWIENLEKALSVVDIYEEAESQLRELISRSAEKGVNLYRLRTIINQIFKDIGM